MTACQSSQRCSSHLIKLRAVVSDAAKYTRRDGRAAAALLGLQSLVRLPAARYSDIGTRGRHVSYSTSVAPGLAQDAS
jgi:hypothetical protein